MSILAEGPDIDVQHVTHGQHPGGAGKTCTACRQKKIKCDGGRPQCLECSSAGLSCAYAQDARREPRPSRARIQNLEATVAALLEHMKTSGIPLAELQSPSQDWALNGTEGVGHDLGVEYDRIHQPRTNTLAHLASTANVASPLPTPSTSGSGASQHGGSSPSLLCPSTQARMSPRSHAQGLSTARCEGINNEGSTFPSQETDTSTTSTRPPGSGIIPSPPAVEAHYRGQDNGSTGRNPREDIALTTPYGSESGMSPCEARVAGAFHEDGCVSSVHGLAGMMNPISRAQHKQNIATMAWKGEGAVAASKARLVSNAALQRQREARLYRQPSNLVDFDECDPELARHLLDLHFNRQHYAYMVSYRPAIMESLINGGGPWANKLLLNAIYYSGTLYSDRQCLRSDSPDPSSTSARFYQRFRQLLVDELDKPSIPTAVALLLTSATLVSQGQSSAGWSLSGTAYRMIIDLGCHLMLGPDYQSLSNQGHSRQLLRGDLEQEMRKRLYWGAHVTDATQALYLGRPCMFATVEARVPLRFLDTFEELEEWEPYLDPHSPDEPPPPYAPQPAHALSTFSWLARLFQVSTRITELYGIQTIKCTSEYLRDKKAAIEKELADWSVSLPAHLKFDPDASPPTTIPPPHQITPHTTFHALTILLHRAFLEEGHLRRHCDEGGRKRCEETCISSALAIEKLVRAYRQAFTLRRAPFLLSYAVYSAVIVILRQERHDRGHFTETISFFWTCLSELQRGCNFGLEKPLRILLDMVHELQVSNNSREVPVPIPATGGEGSNERTRLLLPSLDGAPFPFPLVAVQNGGTAETAGDLIVRRPDGRDQQDQEQQQQQGISPDYMGGVDQLDVGFGASSPGFCLSLNQLENDLSHDTLYGLFAPPQAFP